MRTRLLALLTAVALASSTPYDAVAHDPTARARAAQSHKTDYLVATGYAMSGLKARVIRRDAHALGIVGVSGLTVKLDGSGVTRSNRALRDLLAVAHEQYLHGELLVSNWSSNTGDFDPALATTLLSSPVHQRAAADRLAAIVEREGWDGITIDLEAMRSRDRDDLLAFMKLLRDTLPAETPLSMDVGAYSTIAEYRQAGFALGELAKVVDRIAIMTYDQHGATWSGPGPIGGLPWQRKTVKVLLTKVPKEKVDLGVAGYGYTWPKTGTGHSISPRRARAIAAADAVAPVWHERVGEWSARLRNGTVIWWSDAQSYGLRLNLADKLGLHGVALWALGPADPLP